MTEPTIQELQSKIAMYEQDGMTGLYYALNYQVNRISEDIRSAEIRLDGNDKTFERFISINKALRDMLENLDWLKIKLGLKDDDTAQKKSENIPLIEQRANGSGKTGR